MCVWFHRTNTPSSVAINTMASSLVILDTVFVVLGLYILRRYLTNRFQPPLPPGPRGLPIVGNVLDMPSSYEWLTTAEWTKRWGT